MKEQLSPLMMLEGRWKGKGTGSYGPFSADMDVEVRGRWLLMRQEIKVPVIGVTTYVSTQIYGYDDNERLTLDFFDTAGSFHFLGSRDGDLLHFRWEEGSNVKDSQYWLEGKAVAFKYCSDVAENGSDKKHVTFEGIWEPAE